MSPLNFLYKLRLWKPKRKGFSLIKLSFLNTPSFFLLAGAIGALLGPSIILFGYPFPQGSPSQTFITKPYFLTFLFLVASYTSLLAILFCPLWRSLLFLIRSYMKYQKLKLITLEVIVVILPPTFFFFFAPALLSKFIPSGVRADPTLDIEHLSGKILTLVILGVSTFAPAALGNILISKIARLELKIIPIALPEVFNDIFMVKKYLYYRELIQLYLYSSGAIIGLITLIAGALRQVRMEAGFPETRYPHVLIITLGLYWSAILALYYAIGYLSLLDCGRKLQEAIYPLNSITSLIEDMEKRRKIGDILQLSTSFDQSFRNGIAIFAPLLSGIISQLLPKP